MSRREAISKMLSSEGHEGTSHQRTGSVKHTADAGENGNILDYLHEYDYAKEPNREWIWNLVYILTHEKFQEFILNNISQRETELMKIKNLQVRAIPEIVDIIKKSRAISKRKGKSYFLLRYVVKRKSKKQAELEEKKENEQREYVSELKSKLDEIKDKIQQFELADREVNEKKKS